MSRKKNTSWVVTILAIGCLFSAAWYFFKSNKPSTMDTMQHPPTSLQNDQICPTAETVNTKETSLPTSETTNPSLSLTVTTHEITEPVQLQTIIQDGKPAVIKFYAPWCGACNHVDSYYKDVAAEFNEKVSFYSLNVDTPGLSAEAEKQGINKEKILYLPTFVFFQTGKVQEQQTGVLQKEALIKKVATVFDITK